VSSVFSISTTTLTWTLAAFGLLTLLLLVVKVPLGYIARNLLVRWRTTLLTALAFTLVVSLLTVMLAFVNGMYRLTSNSGRADNVIILSDGATDEIFSNLPPSDIGDIENQPGILRTDGAPLASRETYLVVNQPLARRSAGGQQRRFLQLRGIDDARLAAGVHNLRLLPGGRWFSEVGVEDLPGVKAGGGSDTAIQAVLGEGIAWELGHDRSPAQQAAARNPDRLDVGDTFVLSQRTWLVVGVMDSSGSTFGSEVWAKRSIIGPMFGKNNYTAVVLRATDAQAARRLKDYFVRDYRRTALLAQTEMDYYTNLSETNKQFLYAIVFVTIVMAVGGMFGVMNTMFAAISQRTKDLGVMRLVGFKRTQILVALLLESLGIALVGGLLGCALGSLCHGLSATSVVSSGPGGGKFVVLRLTVDADVLLVGLLVSLAMGLLGGLLPALSALRLRPLESLR
jgi:ABC-type lipoprotein release transport system permease subunit